MTTVNRALTPAQQLRYSLANISLVNNNGITPIKLSLDRTTVYGNRSSDNTLMQSQDGGSSWTVIHTFSSPITGIMELANGECLVLLTNGASFPSYVYKSTGWSTVAANRPSATWALTFTTAGGQCIGKWSGNRWCVGTNGVVVISTYGAQTVAGGPSANTNMGRYVYLSTDFGSTFNLIYDIYTSGAVSQPTGVHIHSAVYYEPDDRIWISYGDNTGQGYSISGNSATKLQLAYSDDRGVTWNYLNIPADFTVFTSGNSMQFTTLAFAVDGSLIVMPDSPPYNIGFFRRLGYRNYGLYHSTCQEAVGGTPSIGSFVNRDNPAGPWFATHELDGTALQATSNSRSVGMYASVDGLNWHSLYVDTPRRITSGEYYTVNLMGPLPNGKVIASYSYKNGGAWPNGAIFTADLVGPA